MLILETNNSNLDIQYYINTNRTILYIYNKNKNQIKRFFADKWPSMSIEVKVVKEGVESVECLDFKTIISKDAQFIKKVSAIASTIKKAGFFTELEEDTGITYNFLNEFLGSASFLESKTKNKYPGKKSISKLLKDETPAFNLLINNLFYNENKEVIENFLRWLRVCSFEDKHQDILYLFCGTSEILQGQGAGKGVLIDLLNSLLSGLVVSVSNADYESNFNSNIMNKKVVVFDEVNFSTLKYEVIKNITGSNLLRVEFKGKEPINSYNVSSWLLFTNESDLKDKLTFDDRRTFLIRPNPKNGSLMVLIKNKYRSFDNFKKALYSEKEKIVHILAKCEGKVLSPLELMTASKMDYFRDKKTIEVIDLKDLYQFLSNKEMFKKLLAVLKTNDLFTDKEKIKFLKTHSINYKLFNEIFQVLLKNGLTKKESPLFAWERLKEFSLKNGYKMIDIEMSKTKRFKKYKDKTLLLKSNKSVKEIRELKQKLREMYGKYNDPNDFDFNF
mgnify:CR=1 FL=1